MSGHLLGMLEPASVLLVNRHTGRAPGLAPDRRQKPRVSGSFANSCPYEIAWCVHFGANRFQPTLPLSVQFFTIGGVTPSSS